eukprot:g9069.t1
MLEEPLLYSDVPSSSNTASCRSSRIPSAPVTTRRGVTPTLSEKWNSSMIPLPQCKSVKKASFPLDKLPPGVLLEIVRELAKTNVKDPVRLGAVSRNCYEAFVALKESDKRFDETLRIFRGEYDHFGGSEGSRTRHKYRIRRLGMIHQIRW